MRQVQSRRSNVADQVEFAVHLVIFAAVGWFVFCVINATFWYSLEDPGDDIMWRQGLQEPFKQIEELLLR
jgi:hypothetical protein